MSVFGNAFYRNDGDGKFTEISDAIGAENYWPWGLSAEDINADGWTDVFITSSMGLTFRYAVNSLLLNERGERFHDSEFIVGVEPRKDGATAKPWFEFDADGPLISSPAGSQEGMYGKVVTWDALATRTSALFDLDDDGDLDIVTLEWGSTPLVLISDLSEQKPDLSWLQVRLVGSQSNRDGLGAEVTIVVGDKQYVQVHDGKSGYLSQSLLPLYFGLAEATQVDRIEIAWPSGAKQVMPGPIAQNQRVTLTEPSE